jgi:hypothetical protein
MQALSDSPEFKALVGRLQNVDALGPIMDKVKKGDLKAPSAIKRIAELVAKEEESGGADAPDYSRGYYGGDDGGGDDDDPRHYRKSGKKKRKRHRDRHANDHVTRDLHGHIGDEDDGSGDQDENERMRPEGFGVILNRFRQLLAG